MKYRKGVTMEQDIEILEDYIELIKKGYCEDCNELCNIYGAPTYPAKKISEANEHLIKAYKELEEENKQLKEYIFVAPNLDEMTAVKYSNIQRDAYFRGRAEEQRKAEQIIYENFIPKSLIKEKIEELSNTKGDFATYIATSERIKVLYELLGEEK